MIYIYIYTHIDYCERFVANSSTAVWEALVHQGGLVSVAQRPGDDEPGLAQLFFLYISICHNNFNEYIIFESRSFECIWGIRTLRQVVSVGVFDCWVCCVSCYHDATGVDSRSSQTAVGGDGQSVGVVGRWSVG